MSRSKPLAAVLMAGMTLPAAAQPFEITHNRVDDLVEEPIVVACTAHTGSSGTADNAWWRAFDLGQFGLGDVTVREVRFGIESMAAPSHGGQTEVTVNLYQAPAGAIPARGFELRGAAKASFADQRLTVVSMDVEACIDAGSSLIVEIAPQDFTGPGERFEIDAAVLGGDHAFLGANNRGETAPSYLSAPKCDIPEPRTYDEIGIGGVAVVMTVVGDRGHDCPADCYPDCDGSGSLDFFDFLCFQNAFAAGEPYADCDGSGEHDFFDFLCFQNAFAAGCP